MLPGQGGGFPARQFSAERLSGRAQEIKVLELTAWREVLTAGKRAKSDHRYREYVAAADERAARMRGTQVQKAQTSRTRGTKKRNKK